MINNQSDVNKVHDILDSLGYKNSLGYELEKKIGDELVKDEEKNWQSKVDLYLLSPELVIKDKGLKNNKNAKISILKELLQKLDTQSYSAVLHSPYDFAKVAYHFCLDSDELIGVEVCNLYIC